MLVSITHGPHKGLWLDIYKDYLDEDTEIRVCNGRVYVVGPYSEQCIGFLDDLLVDEYYRGA